MNYFVQSGGKIRLNGTDQAASVLQNVSNILATKKGSVPLYREFGLSQTFLDKPTPVAQVLLISEIKEAIETFEPRAQFVSASFQEDVSLPGRVVPVVGVKILES